VILGLGLLESLDEFSVVGSKGREKLVFTVAEHHLTKQFQADCQSGCFIRLKDGPCAHSRHDWKQIVVVSHLEGQGRRLHGIALCIFDVLDCDAVEMTFHEAA